MLIEEVADSIEEIVRNHGMGISYFGDISITSLIKENNLLINYQTTEGSDMCDEFKKVMLEVVEDFYSIKNGTILCY
uniref:Imm40 domain-containing protein n=1 Tax=Strongyloides stercoralis TaxID=6248 RepID=A0A0K0EQ49_STRER